MGRHYITGKFKGVRGDGRHYITGKFKGVRGDGRHYITGKFKGVRGDGAALHYRKVQRGEGGWGGITLPESSKG